MNDANPPPIHDFLFYDTEDGTTRVQLLVEEQSVWLPQKAIAELFETTVANVNTHIKNIFTDAELGESSVIKHYLITAANGKTTSAKAIVSDFDRFSAGVKKLGSASEK